MHYSGRSSAAGYHCPGKGLANERGVYCLNVGGVQLDRAASEAVLEALRPAGI